MWTAGAPAGTENEFTRGPCRSQGAPLESINDSATKPQMKIRFFSRGSPFLNSLDGEAYPFVRRLSSLVGPMFLLLLILVITTDVARTSPRLAVAVSIEEIGRASCRDRV